MKAEQKAYHQSYMLMENLMPAGTISTEPNTILGNNWQIGRFMDRHVTNFNGNIDELKVYNDAFDRSAGLGNVQNNYNVLQIYYSRVMILL